MKIYIKEKNRFKQIFDSSKESKRSLYYTTSSHLQQAGSLDIFINKKIRKTIQFKALPPAKRDKPSIKLELNRLSELRVELIKTYFQHSERTIIELTPQEAAGFKGLLWGGLAFTALLIIAVPSFLYLTGLLPFFSENLSNKTELVESKLTDSDSYQKAESDVLETSDSLESSETAAIEDSKSTDSKSEAIPDSSKSINEESIVYKEESDTEALEKEKRESALTLLKSYAERTMFYFQKDRASLLPGEEEKLNRLIALLKESPSVSIIVEGHSAYIGLTANEERISKARAETVRNYLLKNSGLKLNISITYYGSRKPVDHTSDAETERRVNRRAKVVIVAQ